MGDRNDQTLMDKSMRSVFVGNIPYEATEEKLKDIFCEVGPVLSLKLVFDRESGKPKGYGFCEYKDQETALSAMRNLNGYEFGGRSLRVDNACTEKSRMEMAALLQGPQVENPYGEECNPQETPDIIARVVTGLQPDQMYEMMRQAKICVQNDPNEARTMLLENPQLTYALLQSAVVMRIIDAHAATSFLHGRQSLLPTMTEDGPILMGPNHEKMPAAAMYGPETNGGSIVGHVFHDSDERQHLNERPHLNERQHHNERPHHNDRMGPAAPPSMDMDLRLMDPFVGQRAPEVAVPEPFLPADPRQQRPMDPRLMKDPRLEAAAAVAPGAVLGASNKPPPASSSIDPNADKSAAKPGTSADASDQEKAALIMQVLQLSDEQIALLPQDQRASILVLKEQISRNTQK
ncbi:cleavage stimulation factor subunit 2-like [Anopheles bellator]|uniref:cleavage stimulation factor subunit 2-like n=1 Tax=Anopheles bellator TaxID=139047 RepID=UPI00264A0D37|nr:cleavage stimulation factor subunit 2-like [Anopheles bellator]